MRLTAVYDTAAVVSVVSLSAELNWELGEGKATGRKVGVAAFFKGLDSLPVFYSIP